MVDPHAGLRGLVGAGPSRVSLSAALRARDLDQPTDADLAAAELEIDRRLGPATVGGSRPAAVPPAARRPRVPAPPAAAPPSPTPVTPTPPTPTPHTPTPADVDRRRPGGRRGGPGGRRSGAGDQGSGGSSPSVS